MEHSKETDGDLFQGGVFAPRLKDGLDGMSENIDRAVDGGRSLSDALQQTQPPNYGVSENTRISFGDDVAEETTSQKKRRNGKIGKEAPPDKKQKLNVCDFFDDEAEGSGADDDDEDEDEDDEDGDLPGFVVPNNVVEYQDSDPVDERPPRVKKGGGRTTRERKPPGLREKATSFRAKPQAATTTPTAEAVLSILSNLESEWKDLPRLRVYFDEQVAEIRAKSGCGFEIDERDFAMTLILILSTAHDIFDPLARASMVANTNAEKTGSKNQVGVVAEWDRRFETYVDGVGDAVENSRGVYAIAKNMNGLMWAMEKCQRVDFCEATILEGGPYVCAMTNAALSPGEGAYVLAIRRLAREESGSLDDDGGVVAFYIRKPRENPRLYINQIMLFVSHRWYRGFLKQVLDDWQRKTMAFGPSVPGHERVWLLLQPQHISFLGDLLANYAFRKYLVEKKICAVTD